MSGLEDIVAATSSICDVNGKEGRLIYQGYDIHDLAEHSTFEEVVYLLWFGRLPTRTELEKITRRSASKPSFAGGSGTNDEVVSENHKPDGSAENDSILAVDVRSR